MAKHEPTVSDLDKPYEENVIGLGGIMKFAVGLLILIVVTFALMRMLYGVLEDTFKESKTGNNPMAMTEKEQLPPEPRLQVAPGWFVDTPDGRVNLELMAPGSEYRELHKVWTDQIEHGQTHPVTGTVISMPIEEAKTVFLSAEKKQQTGPEAEKLAEESRKFISDASSGRVASATRR